MLQYSSPLPISGISINLSIALPIIANLPANITTPQSYIELPREECTPKIVTKNTTLFGDTEYIFVITPEQEECNQIFERWNILQNQGLSAKSIYSYISQYTTIEGLPTITIDKASAILLALADAPKYKQYSHRNGLVFIYAGEYRTAVITLFEEKIYSTYAFCSALVEQDDRKKSLEEFKNNWLPEEEIMLMGGCGSIFSKDIPSDAVFSATYIVGKKAHTFSEYGTILPLEAIEVALYNAYALGYTTCIH